MAKDKSVKKKEDRELTFGEKVLGFGAGSIAGGAVGLGGQIGITLGTIKAMNSNRGEKFDMEKLRKSVTGKSKDGSLVMIDNKSPLSSHYASKHVIDAGGAPLGRKSGGKRYVSSPHDNAAITAHELAHSSSKFVNHKAGAVAYGLSTLGTAGALPIAAMIQGARGEDLTKTEAAGMLGVSAPMLYEESRANIKAFQALRKMKHRDGLLRASLPLIGSQLSYTGMAALPFAIRKGAKTAREYVDKNIVDPNSSTSNLASAL